MSKNTESAKINGLDITAKTFLNRLEQCGSGKKAENLPFYIRMTDPDLNVDFAQTGWRVNFDGGLPTLYKPVEDDIPSNFANLSTVSDIISDFYEYEKTAKTSILSVPVYVRVDSSTVYPLSDLFGKGGIRFGRGIVDLDILGMPTTGDDAVQKEDSNYYIIESGSCKPAWTYGEVFISSIRKVVLTGSPRYRTPYFTKEEWLFAHKNEFVEVSNLKDADILFTDDLKSTTVKMNRARKLGVEIKEYI